MGVLVLLLLLPQLVNELGGLIDQSRWWVLERASSDRPDEWLVEELSVGLDLDVAGEVTVDDKELLRCP